MGTHEVICLDWLQGVVPDSYRRELADYLDELWDAGREELDYGFSGYGFSYCWQPWRVRLHYDLDEDRAGWHGNRALLCIPGQALQHLEAERHLTVLQELIREYSFKATRVDVAFDDYRRTITPSELAEVANQGHFTGYRRFEHKNPRRADGTLERDQINFGRRGKDGSGRYLKIYDRALLPDGATDAIRWEVEFSKSMAADVARDLSRCSSVADFAGVMGGLVAGSIDFVERGAGKNPERFPRFAWWESLRERMGSAHRVAKRNPIRNIQSVAKWIRCSVARPLAMLREAFGPHDFNQWLQDIVSEQAAQLSHKQICTVEAFHREGGWTRLSDTKPDVPVTGVKRVTRAFMREYLRRNASPNRYRGTN